MAANEDTNLNTQKLSSQKLNSRNSDQPRLDSQGLDALSVKLTGRKFNDRSLLRRSLTHSSYSNAHEAKTSTSNYERLEFLGDRVLGLAISSILFDKYPYATEAALSRHLAHLVRKERLAEIARVLELKNYILIQQQSDSELQESILADTCEAVIGAIYIEHGWDFVKDFILKHWGELISSHDSQSTDHTDAKTKLQEWAQKSKLGLPLYSTLSRHGSDHKPVFVIEVSVAGNSLAQAKGPNKRLAEQLCANEALKYIASQTPQWRHRIIAQANAK